MELLCWGLKTSCILIQNLITLLIWKLVCKFDVYRENASGRVHDVALWPEMLSSRHYE